MPWMQRKLNARALIVICIGRVSSAIMTLYAQQYLGLWLNSSLERGSCASFARVIALRQQFMLQNRLASQPDKRVFYTSWITVPEHLIHLTRQCLLCANGSTRK